MKLLDKQTSENARAYAVRVLLYNIINLELPPGSAVSEKELSTAMNLSRTPIREALIELAKQGLVEIVPQRGSYITKINYDIIEESKFMRLVLENAILELACKGIPQESMDKLRRNLEAERQFSAQSDSIEFLELDNEFHKLIFQSVHKSWTYEIVRAQMIHFDRLRVLSLKSIKGVKTVADHEDIFYAIGRHDSELACMLMTRHLTRHTVEKSELLKLYPDYFIHS